MGDNSKDFFSQLDELIALFERLHDKASREGVITKNDLMYKNFEMLTGNYKLIKNTIPPELIEEMGGPLKDMIAEMVNELRKELGDEGKNSKGAGSLTNELEAIDNLLQKGDLTEAQINELLDQRPKTGNS